MSAVSDIGLLLGLVLLIVLTVRGVDLLIAAPLCALLVAVTSGFVLFPSPATGDQPVYTTAYLGEFTRFITAWFFLFLLGAIFGKVMEAAGSAASVARWIINRAGAKHAVRAVVLACAALTYGGVSVFTVAFAVYPLALSLLREADVPRRFLPAALAFGSITFTMTSAGSPEIQNLIPMKFFGTTPTAGWRVSLVVALLMASLGFWWLERAVNRARARGEHFEARASDPPADARELPHHLVALLPLVAVVGIFLALAPRLAESALIVALVAGILLVLATQWRFLRDLPGAVTAGAAGAMLALANTSAVVGFGGVAKLTPAFAQAVGFMTSLPGSPLIGAAVAVTVIAGLTGSASGGQAIALPVIAPHYLAQHVNPDALHRIVSIASGGLESLPHNGYVVTTLRMICRESYRDAYPAVGMLTVVIPLLGLIVAIALFTWCA
ncbi:MAG: hypothetical protein WCE48_03895 [Steroidobacteraceae bacterium]